MTQAAAPQQEFSYLGKVYCAASGQWAFRLFRDGEEIAGGAGFDDECEAGDACAAQLPGLVFPIRLVADPEFDSSVLSLPFSGGVFFCPNGYWSFALTLPKRVIFGAFFDTSFAAEAELLRQYPDGIQPCYFTDAFHALRLDASK